MLFHWVAEEVGYGDEAAGFFADFPDVAVRMDRCGHLAELLYGIGAQAGDYAVVKQDKGNHRKDVSPKETRQTERANERRGYQAGEKYQDSLRDGDRMAARAFKNSDALVVVHGVLQNADSLRRRKMMEGTENRAEAGEFSRDFGGVNRFGPVGYFAVRFFFYALESRRVWVQIRETNFCEAALGVAQRFTQPRPRAAAAGTQVHDARSFADLESMVQSVRDAAVDTAEAHGGLQAVGDVVAEKDREPGLVVEFEEGHGMERDDTKMCAFCSPHFSAASWFCTGERIKRKDAGLKPGATKAPTTAQCDCLRLLR